MAPKSPIIATAPGKIILFGEHAVVYGQPAIAVPVHQVQAQATLTPTQEENGLLLEAVNLNRSAKLSEWDTGDPMRAIIEKTLAHLDVSTPPDGHLRIKSDIPIASGLGSGAAVSTAIASALAQYYETDLATETISNLVYEVEKLHHGTPSGIDNTVIAYAQLVCFTRGQPIERLSVGAPFRIAIADSGITSATKVAVGDVHKRYEAAPTEYEAIFKYIGEIALTARSAIQAGKPDELGPLMNQNQDLLREIGVSTPMLESLIAAAQQAGASGAKLSGAGSGGNVIALVNERNETQVRDALSRAGASRVILTQVE